MGCGAFGVKNKRATQARAELCASGSTLLARELTARGVLTAKGGQWDATRVRRLLARP